MQITAVVKAPLATTAVFWYDYGLHQIYVLLTVISIYFFLGEIKTLMIQLLLAVAHLHDNWILHRDIKASNLLLSNKGILKVRLSLQ